MNKAEQKKFDKKVVHLDKKKAEMKAKLPSLQSKLKNLSPEDMAFAAKLNASFNGFAKGGVDGIRRGVAYFENLQKDLIKK